MFRRQGYFLSFYKRLILWSDLPVISLPKKALTYIQYTHDNEDNQALYLRPSKVNWMELRDVE